MSSGNKFLTPIEFKEITMQRQTVVDIVAAWLYATRAIDDAKNIRNIQFSDLFGASDKEFVTLKVYTSGGNKE